MSTIEEVRTAEKKVQEVLDALKKAGAEDPNHLGIDLRTRLTTTPEQFVN